MNEIIIQIIGFACLGFLAVEWISHFDLPELSDKPWRCELCLTYWLSIIPLMMLHGPIGILYAAIASVFANFIFIYK